MKNILITGASRGIGRSTALRAAARGWNVAVNFASDEASAAEVVRAVSEAGCRALSIRGDISAEADVIGMFNTAERGLGPLHGVVINAGIVAPPLPLAQMSSDRLRKTFEVNVFGSYLCARESARRLGSAGPGRAIVIVSSAAARLGSPFEYVDYAGAKGALDTLTIGLSKELGPKGIRVNEVRPGLIDTEIHSSGGQPDRAIRLGATMPLGRAGTAAEVAEAIVWLLSDAASYVTGAILDVAGGR